MGDSRAGYILQNRICVNWEDMAIEIIWKHPEKKTEDKSSPSGLGDNIKLPSIHVTGVTKGEKCGQKKILEKFLLFILC